KITISPELLAEIKSEIPELPDARQERYMQEFGLSSYDAGVLTASKTIADFFDETTKHCQDAKQVANWIMGEVLAYLNAHEQEISDIALTPENLGKLIGLIEKGTISGKIAKSIFPDMMETGADPE